MNQVILIDRKKRKRHVLHGPLSFDELTGVQLAGIIAIKRTIQNIDLQAIEVAALLFNINKDCMRRLTVLQKLQLGPLVEYAFEPVVKMNTWLFKKVAGLIGPADALDNITFKELMYADQRLDLYKKTEDPQQLAELVAILMRRPKYNFFNRLQADKRERLNEISIRHAAGFVKANIDLDTQLAIRFNYVACRTKMSEYFPDLFPQGDEETTGVTKSEANESWLDIAIDLASKESSLGNLHQVEQDNAYLVLKVLNRVIKRHKQQIAELEARK